MAWVIKQILFSYSFDIFSAAKWTPHFTLKLRKCKIKNFIFSVLLEEFFVWRSFRFFIFRSEIPRKGLLTRVMKMIKFNLYHISYLSCCREGSVSPFKYEELSREHFRVNLTLRRPTCQSWHIKVFFSSQGSASTAMSKRWKKISLI